MGGVDVVVPCYQYGRFLEECLTSILSQPVEGLRVLIIDNASTDNSVEVAQQIARDDARVELVARKKNLGPHASYNQGIDWASSEFFMIFDADDVLAPGCLARALGVLSADQDIAFAHGKELETHFPSATVAALADQSPSGNWSITRGSEFISKACSRGNNIVGATTVVRRTSMQKATGYYPTELNRAIDLNMWLRLATFGSVAETTAIQGIRRLHKGQLTTFYRDNLVWDFAELVTNFEYFFLNEGRSLEGSHVARRSTARKIASNALVAGVKRLLKGRVAESRDLFVFAFSTWRRFRDPPPFAVSGDDSPYLSSRRGKVCDETATLLD